MTKIDIDKFVAFWAGMPDIDSHESRLIHCALAAQGLKFDGKEIVSIEPEPIKSGPLEVKAGLWYMCIRSLYNSNGIARFVKDKLYLSPKDEYLVRDDTNAPEIIGAFHGEHFRPATEEEIPHEPKFKAGDWVVRDEVTAQVITVTNDGYMDSLLRYHSFENEDKMHLWTIQDAKDGDILATLAGVFIYNGNNGGGSCPGCYCGINTLGRFKAGVEHHWTGKKVYPATKEQRDHLFQKMKEAGYEWDADKKELRKIQKPDLDNTNGTNTIKFGEEEELTEFEKAMIKFSCPGINVSDITPEGKKQLRKGIEKVMPAIRKQIASEIDVEGMIGELESNGFINCISPIKAYRKGIENTLKIISNDKREN